MWHKLFWLIVGGVLGTVSRYGLTSLIIDGFGTRLTGQGLWGWTGLHWGTLVVNGLGCFAFGLLWALGESKGLGGEEFRLAVMTGFLGAFTTFSTYAFESYHLVMMGQRLGGLAYILAQNALGLTSVWAGFTLGRG